MDLKGKIIDVLGDSITEGCGTSGEGFRFHDLIAKETGAIVYADGIGGTKIARPKNLCDWEWEGSCFLDRAEKLHPDADVVLIFGGSNDYGHGDSSLGKPDSRDEHSFYGAMNCLCERLLNRFPQSKIVFMTPLHRAEEDADRNERGIRNILTLSGYCDIIREVCAHYGIMVFDAYKESGLHAWTPEMRERFMPDGLHPNDAGHRRLADYVRAKLESL